MDSLINDIGPPPYQITVFESVLRDGQAILEGFDRGSVNGVAEITEAIERLEALASICFRALEMDFVTYTMDYTTNSLDGLAGVVWGLKQLLQAGAGQGDGGVCRTCGWALERIGVGVGAKYLWSLRQHPPWIANCHLLAVDVWPDFPRLEASSKAGCTLCGMMRELIMERKPHLSQNMTKSQSEVGVWIDFRYLPRRAGEITEERRNFLERADVYLTHPSVWWPTLVWSLVVESEDESVRNELQVSRPANNNPWADENINLVRSHLATTPPPDTPPFTPTRLLDVGLSSQNNISLFTTPDPHSPTPYAALSYCWGPPADALQQPKLLTSNIARLRRHIPPTHLSPVIHDAITVCRSLDIPYY
ncbi:hypothetical protein QBC39DRAFT_385368 [Podospora conica]|nr:hypothetical protein QBC39DRAFT_385368 [Schizothecium conicum]